MYGFCESSKGSRRNIHAKLDAHEERSFRMATKGGHRSGHAAAPGGCVSPAGNVRPTCAVLRHYRRFGRQRPLFFQRFRDERPGGLMDGLTAFPSKRSCNVSHHYPCAAGDGGPRRRRRPAEIFKGRPLTSHDAEFRAEVILMRIVPQVRPSKTVLWAATHRGHWRDVDWRTLRQSLPAPWPTRRLRWLS